MTSSNSDDMLVLYGQSFSSRLLLGTARYPSPSVLEAAVQRARPAMLDVVQELMATGQSPLASRFDLALPTGDDTRALP